MSAVEFQYIETNGITLHAAVAGPEEGPLAILLHGFPEFWYAWHHQLAPLAEEGYRVVVPDQRGYNLSDKPVDIEQYVIDELRDDIIGLIRHFGRQKAFIIGHDWGGAVGWHLAASRPEHVEKLIVTNMPHPRAMPQVMKKHPTQILRSSYIAFFQLSGIPEKLFETGDFSGLKEGLTRTSLPDTFTDADLERYKTAWSRPGSLSGMLAWYRALRHGSFNQVPKTAVTVPVRLIWGMGDQFLSDALAKESLKFCEDGKGVFIGEATHWVNREQPELVNQMMLRFLKEGEPEPL
ncbi:alpha/beta fold hydrolase [Planococcus lenghuensis]|uniref:Alpha/beta hydrolase n=1 Tax=Planococcus lenghuensis TaxID=2213202 RepID=A0A1Q2KU14_9BACL|nr:alpha/beta hydrolase [Planococcus lenghuensis]AQQ51690.1 alpha/beta hydrolase [Planococcus lenghuensis]